MVGEGGNARGIPSRSRITAVRGFHPRERDPSALNSTCEPLAQRFWAVDIVGDGRLSRQCAIAQLTISAQPEARARTLRPHIKRFRRRPSTVRRRAA